jgi:hypothetical protein
MDNIEELRADAERAYKLGDKELALSIYKKIDAQAPSLNQTFSTPDQLTGEIDKLRKGGDIQNADALQAELERQTAKGSFSGTKDKLIQASQPAQQNTDSPLLNFARGIEATGNKAMLGLNELLPFAGDSNWLNKQREQVAAEQEWMKNAPTSAGVGEFTGNVIKALPALAIAPAASATVGGAALLGGLQNYLTTPGNANQRSIAGLEGSVGEAGGVLIGKVLKPLAAPIARLLKPASEEVVQRTANEMTDDAVLRTMQDSGVDVTGMSPETISSLKQTIMNVIKTGVKPDTAALVRKAEFETLGIKPTLGQITRDPAQFSQEKNLRGLIPSLTNRFVEQGQQMRGLLDTLSSGSQEAYAAGKSIISPLEQYQAEQKSVIDNLYKAARNSEGRYAQVNTQQFSKMANDKLDQEMLGGQLPSDIRNMLNDISSGKIPLNVNNLVQADTVFSNAQRTANVSGNKNAALAISYVRDALNNADIVEGSGKDTKALFDTARKAAADHFATLRRIPALDDVVNNNAVNDTFVKKHILLNPDTDQVKGLTAFLQDKSPDAFQQAKAQVGQYLEDAALGVNPAGDAEFRPDAFKKSLDKFGIEKLSAFYDADEIEKLYSMAKIGAYINKPPAASTVNVSNTGAMLMQNAPGIGKMLGSIPGASMAKGALDIGSNYRAGANALKAEVPTSKMMFPDQYSLSNKIKEALPVMGGLLGMGLSR